MEVIGGSLVLHVRILWKETLLLSLHLRLLTAIVVLCRPMLIGPEIRIGSCLPCLKIELGQIIKYLYFQRMRISILVYK